MKYPADSSSDDELVFSTNGTSIDDAFSDFEEEDDADDIDFDSFEDKDEN